MFKIKLKKLLVNQIIFVVDKSILIENRSGPANKLIKNDLVNIPLVFNYSQWIHFLIEKNSINLLKKNEAF